MVEKELEYLSQFYNVLYNNLNIEKKIINDSLIFTLLKTRDSTRYKAIRKSIKSSNLVPNEILNILLSNGYIQLFEDMDSYIISAKGIWFIEKNGLKINEDIMLNFINDKYIVSNVKNELEDIEKLIIFTMIATRTFSIKSCVDLKKDIIVQNRWKKIFDESYDFLYSLNNIKTEKDKIYGKTGNMHVVTSLFRHATKMVQKTHSIYAFSKKLEYYLNLYENDVFNNDRLSYLFYKLFEGNISSNEINLILDYSNKTSRKESIYIFDIKSHIFSSPDYDIKIQDALLDSISSKSRWEKIS